MGSMQSDWTVWVVKESAVGRRSLGVFKRGRKCSTWERAAWGTRTLTCQCYLLVDSGQTR